jgi:hypothetical protein
MSLNWLLETGEKMAGEYTKNILKIMNLPVTRPFLSGE